MKKLKKISFSQIFNDLFGFEKGIDISDETQVLFRRNIVIKNIIFVSNLVYSILMTIISFITNTNSNWVLTAILFPLTFLVNRTLKNMIFKHKDDMMHQTIAMYIACFYMFLSSIIIYMKMKTGNTSFGEAGYMLIYYSLVVVSLYQNKKLLKTISYWFVVIITILHLTITYNMVNTSFEGTMLQQIVSFISSEAFADICLRTIVLASFILVLYVIVSITQYMQDQRRLELIKRKEVQDEFTNIVNEMFAVTINNNMISKSEKEHVEVVSQVAKRFSEIMGYSPDKCLKVYEYSLVHIMKRVDLATDTIEDNDSKFEYLRNQASLGNEIIKRLELDRLCDELLRAHTSGIIDEERSKYLVENKKSEEEQIILISDMYVSLRGLRSYKRPYNHNLTMETLNLQLSKYFSVNVFERFVRFQDQFEKIYDNF